MLDNCDKSAISSPTNPWPQVDKQGLMASSGRVMEKPVQEQPLKCPRCDSSNTKFCYYNNYSLSQPRHFCKACKRYWTRGGTLRNVPVGGGYRKNKKVKKAAGGGANGSDIASPSLSSFTHTPLSHHMDSSHLNQLLYGLHPNNPSSFTNFPFQRFNSSRNSNNETLPSPYNGYNSQMSSLGLGFPTSSTTMSRDEHDYGAAGGGGFHHNSQIQDLLTSSNSILSNLSLLGSSSAYGTNSANASLILQKQKHVWNELKDSRPNGNGNYQGLLPFENLQMGGNGDGGMVVDMEESKDPNNNANKMEWRVPCENHIEPIGSTDTSMYWNSPSVATWPDLANYGSSVTPLI